MINFSELRQRNAKGEVVWSKRYRRIKTEIQKTDKGFVAYVDGDMLDTFRNMRDAQKSIETAIKELT